jgi:integrase
MNKININFNLLEKRKSRASIIMSITWEGNRIQTSIGVSVISTHFDNRRNKIKSYSPHAMENNFYMDNLSQKISDFYYTNMVNHIKIDKVKMRSFLKSILKKVDHQEESVSSIVNTELTFFSIFEKFIQERKLNPKFGKRSIQCYNNAKKHLERFEAATGYVISFTSINSGFADQFVLYLAHEIKLVNITIDGILRALKTFLNWAYDNDYHPDLKWRKVFSDVSRDFNLKSEANRIVLNNEEIALFENYEPKSKKLERIKDLFLIQIYTGFRVSDLMSLKPEYISMNEEKIVIYQKKTDRKVIIPIHSKLKTILLKYPNLRIPAYSDQRYNDYLKVLGREVGLNTKVVLTYFYGKTKVEKSYEKWELLTSHVARDTCITFLIKKGLIPEYVMKISGHKSRTAFQTYVKIAQEEAQIAVKHAWDE